MPFSIFQKQSPQSPVSSSVNSTPNLTTTPSFTSSLPAPASFRFDMTSPRPAVNTGYSTTGSVHAYSPFDSPSSNFRDDSLNFSPVASVSAYNSTASRVGSISSKTSHKTFLGTRHELKSKSSSHSLKSKLSRKLTSASTKSTSSQQQSLPPIIPELPPLEVPEHYEDLIDLFSRENTRKSQSDSALGISLDLKQPTALTGITETKTPEPISNNRDSVDQSDLHTYEFYDLDKITNSLNPNNNPELESPLFIEPLAKDQTKSFKESIYPSPEPTTPASHQTSTFTNTAATSPTSIQKPKLQQHASFSSKVRRIFSKRQNQTAFATVEPGLPVRSTAKSESQEPQDFSLPFTNSKVVPHFSEINSGPTYKAQVVRPTNTNPQPTIKTNNLDPGSTTYLMNNNSNDTELLNFVPNLRPSINNMGSRFRTTGIATPANIVMTKSQYDKYLLEKKEKKESVKSNTADQQHEDEDDENEDDEDSDDEEFYAPRHALENEETKHQDMRMRMRQDAHLSIYRQKMVKLTGSQIGLINTKSKSKLPVKRDDDDSDEDDVPLGILKTHGFPRRPRTASQPNLAPELTYPKRNKSSDDLDSLHSTPSTGPTTPAVEEGYLAMRNQSFMNLPGFNASVPMNRGLVGEIAKEESARFKRKPMMNPLAGRPKETDGDMINGKNNHSEAEIQAQIQQMMSMQNKILTQMASNNSVAALNFTPTMSGEFPRSSNWSSFDVMNSHQLPISRFNTAPSVKSISNSSSHSVDNQMSAPASEEEDDEDDEKGWKEMELKREQMRQMWKAHQVLVL